MKKIVKENALVKIRQLEKDKNCIFINFCNKDGKIIDWSGTAKTFLLCKCLNCCGIFIKSYNNFMKKKSTCPLCAQNAKITKDIAIQNILKRCEETNSNFIKFCDKNGNEKEWGNNKTYLQIHCNKCDSIYQISYHNFIIVKNNCKTCANEKRKLDLNVSVTKIMHQCNIMGYDFCGFYNDKEEKINGMENSKTKFKLRCQKCNYIWFTTYNNFINNKRGCKICGIKKSKQAKEKDKETVIRLIENKCIEKKCNFIGFVNDKWINCRSTKLNLQCNCCGTLWNPTFSKFINTSEKCPDCAKLYKESETKLFNAIKNAFNTKIIERNIHLPFLNGKEIDIYIKDINIGIEYQGEQHFKPITVFGGKEGFEKTVKRDNEKYKECQNNGVKLFYFSYSKTIPSNYLDTIYNDENKLINEIKKYDNNR